MNRPKLTMEEARNIFRQLSPFYLQVAAGSHPELAGEILTLCGLSRINDEPPEGIVIDRQAQTHHVDPRDLVSTGSRVPPMAMEIP